jgi:hypothetical protein
MRVFFQIAYFVIGAVQFFAIWDGFKYMLGVGSFFGFLLALFITYIPLVGSAMGVYGAIKVWDWGAVQAFVLFFWYLIILVPFYAVVGVNALRGR